MITVGLVLHSAGSANLGVGALTAAEVDILRDIAKRMGTELKIRVLDWKLSRPPYVTGSDIEIVEMTGKTLVHPKGYFARLRDCNLIIDIGAGDSFADIYGSRRLTRVFWMKYLVHIAGRPLVLAPQTYGPFSRRLSIALARGTIQRAVVVASRDVKSTAAVADIAPDVDVVEASDVALRLPFDPPDPRSGDGRPSVGLNVSGLLMGGGYTGRNMFSLKMEYGEMIRTLIARLKAHPEAPEICLVPHVFALQDTESIGVEDDREAALALQDEDPDLTVAPHFESPQAAKSYIAGLDFFAGARMHACIAAFSSGVPVIPMAYSRKFEGLFGSLNYNRTVDCTSEDSKTIVAKVISGFEERQVLLEEMRPALALGLEKLSRYEARLEALMASLLKR